MHEPDDLSVPPRVVRPRTRQHKRLPVVAIAGDDMIDEDGNITPFANIVRELPYMAPTLFVKRAAADWIASLDTHFSEWDDNWQWRATASERSINRPDGLKVASRASVAIYYFGFKGGSYHKIIDPITMYGHDIDKVWPGSCDKLTKLQAWGIALRNFCHNEGIELRPTMGSIGSQFLTDKRFYPKARRKVPMATNEAVREQLPGNHYVLAVHPSPNYEFTALYMDQRRAHHFHARNVKLPDSNQLYAYGNFMDLKEIAFDNTIEDFYGLYCLDLQAPRRRSRFNWHHKLEREFVFSNELVDLLDEGFIVNGVYAAWGSHKQDIGLAKYSRWAEQQLDRHDDHPWIKPLLLSTYGTLATRPRIAETVFKQAKRGEAVSLATGRNELDGTLVRAKQKLEPKIANVLHRGMIEAETRSESVGYAKHLTKLGFRVLSIYADAVIVEEPDDPAILPPPEINPWRLKRKLNHLQFINQQAFVSGEMTKLPGVSRELRDYRQHAPAHAPRRRQYSIFTGIARQTDRRI